MAGALSYGVAPRSCMIPTFPELPELPPSATNVAKLNNALHGRKKSSVIWHALSGTVGSLLAEFVLFPVSTVKLRVQTAGANDVRGFFATALSIIRQHGLQGLYGGVGGAMITEGIHSLNFWLFHGYLFRCFAKFGDTTKTPTTERLLLNLVAKQFNWLCTVPFEAVSTVNQLTENSPGFFHTAVSLYRQGGVGVFYRGLPVSLLLAINPAIMNTLITSLLRFVVALRETRGEDYFEARDHSASVMGIATGLSKIVATLLTYPLIRAKVLQQTSGKQMNLITILQSVIANEGVKGLYRGVLAMSYKTVLWNSFMMAVKHVLDPKTSFTPQVTPPRTPDRTSSPWRRMPLMAREPFPVELVTVEKLNEILSYLHMNQDGSNEQNQRRLDDLEVGLRKTKEGLEVATQEIREVKSLLLDLVAASAKKNNGY
jgi:hypothetical protein